MKRKNHEVPPELENQIARQGVVQMSESTRAALTEVVTRVQEFNRALPEGEQAPQSRRRYARPVLIGVAALLCASVAVPAAAGVFGARTGEFGDPATSTEVDDSEWINLLGSDVKEVIAESYPDGLKLPPSVSPAEAAHRVQAVFGKLALDDSQGVRAQEGLVTTTFEFWAVCAWTNEWLEADDAKDSGRLDSASQWLLNPDNFPSIVANDGGGVVDQLLTFARGARAGDRNVVEQAYRYGACDSLLQSHEQ
jgi:hypothetical protein